MTLKEEQRAAFLDEWKQITSEKPPKSYGILVYNAIYGLDSASEETRKVRLREIYNVWNYGVMNIKIWNEIKRLIPDKKAHLQK